MRQVSCHCAITGVLLLSLGLATPTQCADDTAQLSRLNVGQLRLYYTDNAPGSIHYQGKPAIPRVYFYTSVKTETGRMIEGFNFYRNADGNLSFAQEAIPGGHRLTWRNKKYVRARPNAAPQGLAGEGSVTLTITPTEVSVRYQAKIEPNEGFGEIGLFVPEEFFTGTGQATCHARLAGGKTAELKLPMPGNQGTVLRRPESLSIEGPGGAYELQFEGQGFPGSQGVLFQDFRHRDQAPGCYRIVVGFATQGGNELDYTWRMTGFEPKAGGAATLDGEPMLQAGDLARVPALQANAEAIFGEAQAVEPIRRSGETEQVSPLKAAIDEKGQISLSEGDQAIMRGEYFHLFAPGTGTRTEKQEGNVHSTSVYYDAPKGELTKRIIAGPDDVWVLWNVKAKQKVRGEVGFYCPQEALQAPFITYRSINQSTVTQSDAPELSSSYCILSGAEDDFRELQCGTSRRPDWIFQDHRESKQAYRFVAVPSLAAGDRWQAVLHYVRNSPEAYPAVSFDQAREERGILSTLLPDVIGDGFTIVPARSAKYTFPGRPLQMTLKYLAVDNVPRTVKADCRLVDMWGRTVSEASYELANQGSQFAAIRFPMAVDLNGAYRLDITCRSGDVVQSRELIFTVMPDIPDTGFRPSSVFGAAIGSGEYLGTLAKRIGLKWNRCHCAIGDTQAGTILPQRGKYTWEAIERAYEFHQRHELYACHSISEGWRAKWLSAMYKERPFEEYLTAFVNEYVKPLAQRFKGRITCWEVTNEPYYQFRESPENWVKLMKATYETLKQIDPDCTVVGTCGPPGSMGYSWYRRTFALGALDYQDAVSSHLYHFGPWVGSGTAVGVRKWMREIRKIMKDHGKVVPLWNSETTVTPPSSVYTHPSHTRYVRYHAGEAATDPVEQAQTYFKVLVMHKAEDVKYSFHIFHGGVEYTSHTAEYDETPLGFLASQAALAKYLETAQYIADVPLHDDVQACLFKDGDRLLLIPWGPMFLKGDYAQVSLPLPASRFTARDVFDNPLPVAGADGTTDLIITWEAFFLLAEGMSTEEFLTACKQSETRVHFAQTEGETVAGTFFGQDARRAQRSDWVGLHPVDLTSVVNRSFSDETPGDGEGGWTDEGENDMRLLPTGEWLINGVPFHIIDPETNNGKSCIVLKGGIQAAPPFPDKISVPVSQRLSKLHLLHTTTWGGTGYKAFRYVLHYTDGFTEQVPVTTGQNVADWWYLGDLPGAKPAWEGPNPAHEKVRIWHVEHEITHPKGAQAMMDRVEIVSECGRPIPVILAITGVYSN